jgi:hypothetical protein
MSAPPSAQRDKVLTDYIVACDAADAFLAENKSEQGRKLEATRAEKYDACGVAWQEVQNCQSEINRLQAQLAHHAMNDVSSARTAAMEADERNFGTPYPSRSTVESWQRKRSAARSALEIATTEHQNIEGEIRFALARHQNALTEVRKLQGELSVIDEQLNAFK